MHDRNSASPSIATISDVVAVGAVRAPRRCAVSELDGRSLSYHDLDTRASRLANGLRGIGLGPGDRIAVWMDDRLEYVELYVAAARAGCVVVPVNARFVPQEADRQIDDADVAALVISDASVDRAKGLATADDLNTIVHVGDRPLAGTIDFADLATGSSTPPSAAHNPDDVFILGYTSGTTGTPKGAMITHRTVRNGSRMNAISHRMLVGGVCAFTGSLSLAAPFCGIVVPHLALGGTTVLLGEWDAERLVEAIRDAHATHVFLPSPVIGDFATAAMSSHGSVRSLASVLHSGSIASPAAREQLLEVIGDRFVEGWGMTETAGTAITATTRSDALGLTDAMDLHATSGRAVVDAAVRVVDEDGTEVSADGATVGEAVVRSAALMAGYWNRPEETAAAFRDGWYHTGDLASVDGAGYLYIAGRRDDMILSGGLNVHPSEVEQIIGRLEGVRECAVVGVPHDRWGQTPVAVVVPASGASLDAQLIIDHCREHLASYKKPTRVVFVSDLPRTASNKVQRHVLREQFGGHAAQATTIASSTHR